MSDFRKDVFFANGGSDHHTAEQNREMTEWQDSEITHLQDNLVDVTQERDLMDSLSVDQKALIKRLQGELDKRDAAIRVVRRLILPICRNSEEIMDEMTFEPAPDTGDK